MTDFGDDFDLSNESAEHVIEQLLNTPWSELEAIECQGRVLFPDKIYRARSGGKFEEVPVMIRVPRTHELRRARVAARKRATDEGLDLDRDRDLISDMENMHILQEAIRNAKPGTTHDGDQYYEPWVGTPDELEKLYDRGSLAQIWAKLEAYMQRIDPAPPKMTPNETLAVIAAIAKGRSIAPLHVFGSGAQTSCIVTMADMALNYLASRSSSESSEP